MPAARRNFIDGFAGRLYPGHLPSLLRYRQIIARRNRLLQDRPADEAAGKKSGPKGPTVEAHA